MTKANKIIKVIGDDGCKDCAVLLDLINEYVRQKKLEVKIEKIQSVSDEAIDLAVEFDINKIPFAIFENKKLVFDKETGENDLNDFFFF